MITLDEFKNLVKGSIVPQSAEGKSMTYVRLNDEACVCPFCGAVMMTEQVRDETLSVNDQRVMGPAWIKRCDCDDAVYYNNELNEIFAIANSLQPRLDSLNSFMKEKALATYKKFYFREIIPSIQDELNNRVKALESLKELD